jgi:hypothetical protein
MAIRGLRIMSSLAILIRFFSRRTGAAIVGAVMGVGDAPSMLR